MEYWKRAAVIGGWGLAVVWASIGCWMTQPNSSCNKTVPPPTSPRCGYLITSNAYCASAAVTENFPGAKDSTVLSQQLCSGFTMQINNAGECGFELAFNITVMCRDATGESCGDGSGT